MACILETGCKTEGSYSGKAGAGKWGEKKSRKLVVSGLILPNEHSVPFPEETLPASLMKRRGYGYYMGLERGESTL